MSGPEIRQGVLPLGASRYLDGTQMYPGKWLGVWVKLPHMPWMLSVLEPVRTIDHGQLP